MTTNIGGTNTNIGKQLYDIMDALVALRIDLKCDPEVCGDVLVLSADKARAACEALDAASASIKKILGHLDGSNLGGRPPH